MVTCAVLLWELLCSTAENSGNVWYATPGIVVIVMFDCPDIGVTRTVLF